MLIALHTGMRRGEICNLQWFDLNFDRGLIHVRNTKNGKDRIIPMNGTVRQLLEMQKVLRARKAQENAEKGKPRFRAHMCFRVHELRSGLVEIKYSFAQAAKQAKITDLRFHDLRHTAATRMGDAGADAFTLAAIFGWSDIRMAMRYHACNERCKAKTGRSNRSSSTHVKMQRRKFHVTGA